MPVHELENFDFMLGSINLRPSKIIFIKTSSTISQLREKFFKKWKMLIGIFMEIA